MLNNTFSVWIPHRDIPIVLYHLLTFVIFQFEHAIKNKNKYWRFAALWQLFDNKIPYKLLIY